MSYYIEDKKKLKKIQHFLRRADTIFQSLNIDTQDYTFGLHSEQHSLGYCLRWGEQAADDALDTYNEEML